MPYNCALADSRNVPPASVITVPRDHHRRMNVFYEEEGTFKVGAVLADNDTSLQVEAPHGKRSKVKSSNVLFRFEGAISNFMEDAQKAADSSM